MKSKKNLIDYIKSFSSKIEDTKLYLQDFHKILKILNKYRKKNRVHIFGNGGSATIASHFSMDLTNNTNINRKEAKSLESELPWFNANKKMNLQ